MKHSGALFAIESMICDKCNPDQAVANSRNILKAIAGQDQVPHGSELTF